MKSTERVAV